MGNMDVYQKVRTVPPEALKPITGGRLKGMSDINPMWRIKMLTEVFGICGIGWKTVITDRRLEKGHKDEVVCFVDVDLYVKVDGEWSEPIPGMGGSSFITQERNGVHTSDECFKMAYTDAISVACKSLGFAADVYFEKDRTKYTSSEEAPTVSPEVLKGKWIELAGNDEGFKEWYDKQIDKKVTPASMDKLLTQKLAEKKKESA